MSLPVTAGQSTFNEVDVVADGRGAGDSSASFLAAFGRAVNQDLSSPGKADPGASSLPGRMLTLSSVLAVALFLGSGWVLFRMSVQVPATYADALAVQALLGRIDYLDEALTSSAQLAVGAGDSLAVERYVRLDGEIYSAIDSLGRLEATRAVQAEVEALSQVADRLGDVETQALEMLRRGRATEAAALLASASYGADKRSYQDIEGRILQGVHRWQEGVLAAIRGQLRGVAIFAGVSALLMLLTGRAAGLVVRRQTQRERKREADTEAQRRHFELLFDGSPDAIVTLDDDDRVIRVNEQFVRLFGYASEELTGRTLAETIVPADLVDESWGLNRTARSGHALSADTVRRTKDGRLRPVTIRGTRIEMPDGTQYIYGIYRDVTEQMEAQVALEESEERYRSLFMNNPNAVFSLNLEGSLTRLNPAAILMSAYEESELLGRGFTELVAEKDRERAARMLEMATAGSTEEWEIELLRKDGAPLVLHGVTLPVWVRGELHGVFGIAENWTERRRLEDRLRRAQRLEAIGQLAGGVAHDFNNILTAISGLAELAMEEVPDGSDLARDLGDLRASAARGTVLARELLSFSRKQPLQPRIFALNSVLDRQARMIQRVVGADIEVIFELDDALLPVRADPDHVEHSVLNLVMNARDAMPGGGRLVLSTRNAAVPGNGALAGFDLAPGTYALLTVGDTGVGMDEATVSRIFEPFFTTKEKGRGTGLGLSSVFGVVKQSGGDIRVDSALGAGTRFHIALPSVIGAPDPPPPERVDVPGGGAGELILVVEDDAPVRSLVRRTLQRNGYRVVEAADATAALAILDTEESFRLLITDLVMPGMSGSELAARTQDALPDLPVLFMSGYGDQEIVRRGLRHSEAPLLRKPFSPHDLLKRVASLLQGTV